MWNKAVEVEGLSGQVGAPTATTTIGEMFG